MNIKIIIICCLICQVIEAYLLSKVNSHSPSEHYSIFMATFGVILILDGAFAMTIYLCHFVFKII